MSIPNGLRDPESVVQRGDNTAGIVGAEGIPVRQDIDGTQIQRLGIAGADADWGPEQVDITDGDAKIADPAGVGGTRSSSGIVRSLDDEPCSVVYVWESEGNGVDTLSDAQNNPNVVIERDPAVQSDPTNIIEKITTKGDNCSVFVEDDSAQGTDNNIEYTLNFH